MNAPSVGDVVLVRFPFSDLSANAAIMQRVAGRLTQAKHKEVVAAVVGILHSGSRY